jgi:V/A-type H+-transporting ATPase subunit C
MPKYKDTDYLHISARIKFLETRLLSNDSYEKMIEARSGGEALRILTENGYNNTGLNLERPEDFEKLLSAEQNWVYEFLSKNINNNILIDIFRLPYDYLNIKALIKAELLNIDPGNMLYDAGTIGKNIMITAFRERNDLILSKYMTEAIALSLDSMAKTSDPQQIDLITDVMCYDDILQRAKDSEFDFLADFLYTRVDLINIITFIRLHRIKKDRQFFKRTYINGRLSPEFFTELYELPIQQFYEALTGTAYKALAEKLLGNDELSITEVELSVDEYIGTFIKGLRSIPFGPQIPVAYLLSKEAEIKNIRIIMTGKIAGLSSDIIRERLRLGYV